VRIKSRWFRSGTDKSAAEIASAAAFIVFRIAQNALKNMRAAGYELPPGAPYFAFLAEFLAFLTLGADRIAHARGDEAWRVEFTTAMANRVGEFLAGNEADLLGADTPEGYKRRFIALVDEFYDRNVKLVLSAHATPEAIYRGQRLDFEFERTRSRLAEMQTHEYLARPHRP